MLIYSGGLRIGESIRLRKEDNPALRARMAKTIDRLRPETLSSVVRAFNIYFSLVNIAEEAFQHKQRRRHARQGGPLWRGSFDHTLREFHAQNIGAAQIQTLLDNTLYLPVFTAHPTELKRRSVMHTLRGIFLTAEKLDALAQILYDRPALQLEIAGYADPTADATRPA